MLFCCKISLLCDLRCFVAKSVLSLFTRFGVEKNWAKNFVCGEKRTNIRYDHNVFLSNFCHITLRSSSFKCNICQKKFQKNIKLEEHYTNKHVANIISMHQCSSCEYSTMNKYYLKQHIKRQHVGGGTMNFVCNKCYARKPNEYLLKKHMQQHIESICVICKRKFNAKKDLKRHIKVHEVKRCEECGKWFSGTKEFRLHRQFHKRNKKVADEIDIQSGASSLAKHGGAYFSAVCGSIQDPIAAPGLYENQEP